LRESLKNLIDKTIIYKYSLPNNTDKIDQVNLSNHKDDCYDYSNDNDLIELIYNSIIEYSFNEFDLTKKDYLSIALQTKMRYDERDKPLTKLKYGFFGEVLLYSFLHHIYRANPLISRGYFFNPLEKSETKGYDSYHLIENDGVIELWFGEVKFRDTLYSGAKSAIEGLDKAFTDDYLKNNIIAMNNFRNNFAIKDSKIEEILNDWDGIPIKIIDEVIKHNMTLVYPILLVYPDNNPNYHERIKKAVGKINEKFTKKTHNLSINYKIFFIFLPISEVKKVKQEVIKWIELKKPLLS
jgi:hypothetical protein